MSVKLCGSRHLIRKGENLTQIARKILRDESGGAVSRPTSKEVRETIRQLCRINKLSNPNRISAGKALLLLGKDGACPKDTVAGAVPASPQQASAPSSDPMERTVRTVEDYLNIARLMRERQAGPKEDRALAAVTERKTKATGSAGAPHKRETKVTVGRARVEPAGKPLPESKPTATAPRQKLDTEKMGEMALPEP